MAINLDIVDRYEDRFGKHAALRNAIDFMISYLSLMQAAFPPEAQQAFDVAKRYYMQSGTREELDGAATDCWNFLQERSFGFNVNTPEVYCVQAVSRLLYPDPDETDVIDIVGYFLTMANGFEDHSEQAKALLSKHFSKKNYGDGELQ